jgi:hypothetical protein
MTNALGPVDKNGFPIDHAKHISFRAYPDASSAPDAGDGIDLGMNSHRSLQPRNGGSFKALARLPLLLPVVEEIRQNHRWDQDRRNRERDKRIVRHLPAG